MTSIFPPFPGLFCFTGNYPAVSNLQAAEPHERFLERLREEQFFDLALLYLEDIAQKPDLDEGFSTVIDLERALLTFQAANFLPLNSPGRAEKLDETEAALKRFLEQYPKHQRRSEARLKLGALYQLRAQEALAASSAEKGSVDVPDAIRFFDQAHELFESTIAELAQIETGLRGDRIDSGDPAQVAYRDRIRGELREAQLLSAKSVEDRGRSRSSENPQRAQDLQTARQMYTDFYSKVRSIGLRNLALFYRSGIFRELGQPDDAIDGYLRIIDIEGIEGIDALKSLQTEAVTELIGVLADEGKFELATQRAERWLGRLRTDEKNTPEALALQVELARIQIDWAGQLKSDDPGNRQISRIERSTRSALRALMRVPGPHTDEVKRLLATLGVEKTDPSESSDLPKVEDLGQALTEAQSRIDDADAVAVNLAVVQDRLADEATSPEDVQALRTEQAELIDVMMNKREQALELLRQGLRLYDRKSEDRSQLLSARLRMAYLLLKLNRPVDALVVGESLSRAAPGTPQGLNAASIALTGYSELLQREDVDQGAILSDLSPFRDFLVTHWPQSTEAARASSALTQLAVVSRDWDRAERYLEGLSENDPGLVQRYFELGASLYDQYSRSASDMAAGNGQASDEADRAALRDRAMRWLRMAADRIDDSQPNLAVSVASALASLKLSVDQTSEAAEILLTGDKAPMKWLEAKKDEVPPSAAMDAYRTAVRVIAAQVAAGDVDVESATDEMKSIVERLYEVASENEQAAPRLPGILASIARDLKENLGEIKQPQRRAQFADVVLLVLDEAGKSDSFATQYWAANSKISIAEELESNSEGKAAASKALGSAADLLLQMIERAAQQPDWAEPPEVVIQLKVLLARASEGAGDFRTAIQTYGQILEDNENLLDVQISVAKALQRSAAENPRRYEAAIRGARPNPKTGGNIFWGWGKISQVTSRRLEDFRTQFFESRFQLAFCRLQWALSLQDQDAKTAELRRAERALQETVSLYPSLGGVEDVKRYNALMKRIQKELGKPTVGFESPSAS